MPKFTKRKHFTINYKGKVINPKWIEHQNLIKDGWDILDTPPSKYIKGKKQLKFSLPVPTFSMGKIMIDLFMYILPFVLIIVIYNTDFENFDFFYYLERFSKMQPSNTLDAIEEIKKYWEATKDFNAIGSYNAELNNAWEVMKAFWHNLCEMFDSIWSFICWLVNIIRVPFALLIDTIANVITVVGFLFGGK